MGSVVELNDTLQISKEQGFPQELDLDQHLKSPYKAEDFKDQILLPMLGTIAAGTPIETIENPEPIVVSKSLLSRSGRHFVLKVKGNSMINEGIFDGDFVIIREQPTAEQGDTVVAVINGDEATLKKFYVSDDLFLLKSANPLVPPIATK